MAFEWLFHKKNEKDKQVLSTHVTVSLWFLPSYFRSMNIFSFLQEEISFCIYELANFFFFFIKHLNCSPIHFEMLLLSHMDTELKDELWRHLSKQSIWEDMLDVFLEALIQKS